MWNLFDAKRLSISLALLSASVLSSLLAEPGCDSSPGRFYIGAFGGEIYSGSNRAYQIGTAFFTEASGGPLAVYARGHMKGTSSGLGGVQIGHEWNYLPLSSNSTVAPSVELEAYWFCHKKSGHLINDTDRLPEHDFDDTFPMKAGVYLTNFGLSLNSSCYKAFSPYIGAGVGAARISISGAKSEQISPIEIGVNHFNSLRHDSSWAFAAQIKAGLRYNIWESLHMFAEYRYLFVDSSNYIFGSTVDPTHAATSPWNVKMQNIQYNALIFGVQYDL